MDDVLYWDWEAEELELEAEQTRHQHFVEITQELGWHEPDRWFLDPQ